MMEVLARIDEKKKKFDSCKPFAKALEKNLGDWFRIALTYTSNAIEGNTLSHAETALVVQEGVTVGGKSLVEHQEAINHAQAITFIKELASKKNEQILHLIIFLQSISTFYKKLMMNMQGFCVLLLCVLWACRFQGRII